jgi:predicted deacylase
MDWSLTRISTDLDFERDGRQIGDLRLPFSTNDQPLGYHPIPVAVLKNGAGPSLLLLGGTHGDEFEGPAAIMKTMHGLDLSELRGRVIALPALNAPALAASSRCSPIDGGNLNRAFPGDRDGGPTAMIAQMLERVLLPRCDAVIDIHSGGKASVFAPCALINRVPAKLYGGNRDLAEAFGLPFIWLLGALNDDRSVNGAAARQGVPMMACELGGAGTVSPAMMALALGGIRRVMAHLGMCTVDATDQDTAPPRYVEVASPRNSLYAPAGGLFEPCFEVAEDVSAGATAGWLHFVLEPERPPLELSFQVGGLVISRVNRGLVTRGEKLALMATDATP